jgi:hypothetical protein
VIYVHTDHNADAVRTFYEIPDTLAQKVRKFACLDSWDVESDPRTFTQALADALGAADSTTGRRS